MDLEIERKDGVMQTIRMKQGMTAHIAPYQKHRMAAVTDVELVEVSTPELDDVVRHEDDYGRGGPA